MRGLKRVIEADWEWRRCRRIAGSLVAGLLLGLTGCGGAKVIHVEADPTFDYSQASSGEIGIVGFEALVEDEKHREVLRRQLPSLLARAIQEKRPDLKIFSPERIQEAVGEENHRILLDRYAAGGNLDQGGMVELFSATRGTVRYVVLGRVVEDNFFKFEEIEEDSTSSGIRYKVRREMAVFLEVYDLEAGRSVFKELITNDQTSSRYVPDFTAGDSKSCSDACGNMAMSCLVSMLFSIFQDEPDDDGFPPPPTTEEITREIFEKFAESLPTADAG
ncbi:MAG: hypothetical protein KAW46_12785 [candidate division Zixibacteria bacterium]|nr:hypothetical protein [candidate division Zixibacteria bacterium]